MGFGGVGGAIAEMRRELARRLCLCYKVCEEERPGWVECRTVCPEVWDSTEAKSRCNERDDP